MPSPGDNWSEVALSDPPGCTISVSLDLLSFGTSSLPQGCVALAVRDLSVPMSTSIWPGIEMPSRWAKHGLGAP